MTLKEGQSRSQWKGSPNNTVSKSKEIRQLPQCQTDYQNTEAGSNGKSDINQYLSSSPANYPRIKKVNICHEPS
ncbi:hypothetical protein PL8927_630139 [Planktothrix serta PCC 8927]|uniref:Uncharacterized protein n=1 Tax=Planktothrix serta PCC 8927 TaxID=671068 RepID=A0A7Z9BUL9_9CYAN|nr:hypothetical protein PL8927_630139 [Planktothrix serta PCC 8927]